MHGRVDQAIYAISAAEMLNFVPTVEGPAMKRAGFRYIRSAAAAAAWLSTFIFSETQAYVIEWGAGKLRFYTNGGRIESDPVTPYEVTVPYAAAEAPAVSQQQNYDRLYLAHGTYPPAALTRTSATTFSYAALTLKNGPFADRNTDESITVTASATTGSITITATSAIFLAGHVGANFMVEAMGSSDIKAWEPRSRRSTPTRRRASPSARSAAPTARCTNASISAARTGTVQPTHTRGAEWDGSLSILELPDRRVDRRRQVEVPVRRLWRRLITAIGGGGTTATITVTRRLADSLTGSSPSFRWYLPAMSNASGWPKHVLLAFGRLIFFTDFEMICSVVGDYGGGTVNMAPFTDSGLFTPDQAFRKRLAISNPILWAREDRDVILIGTADGVMRSARPTARRSSLRQCRGGEAKPHRLELGLPAQTGVSTIFVQLGGRKLREAGYTCRPIATSRRTSISGSGHILKGGAVQLAFQAEPEELLWAVRGDGQLALHPHVPEQDVRGFARLGPRRRPGALGLRHPRRRRPDQLWALVAGQTAGLSVQLRIRRLGRGRDRAPDAFYVDSGATYNGARRRSSRASITSPIERWRSSLTDPCSRCRR
jgi:hypothetical protein